MASVDFQERNWRCVEGSEAPNALDNTIRGGAGNDSLYGLGGNDTIFGDSLGTGNDLIYGGVGDDVIYGGDGADSIYGESGDDKIYDNVLGSSDSYNDYLDGGTNTGAGDTLGGHSGGDTTLNFEH